MFELFSVYSLVILILLEIYAFFMDRYRRIRYVLFGAGFFVVWYFIVALIDSELKLVNYFPSPAPELILAAILLSGSILSLNVIKATS